MSFVFPFSLSQAPECACIESVAGPWDLSGYKEWRFEVSSDVGSEKATISTAYFDDVKIVLADELAPVLNKFFEAVGFCADGDKLKCGRYKGGDSCWLQVVYDEMPDGLNHQLKYDTKSKHYGQDGIGEISDPSPEYPQTTMTVKNYTGMPMDAYGAIIDSGSEQSFSWSGSAWEPDD